MQGLFVMNGWLGLSLAVGGFGKSALEFKSKCYGKGDGARMEGRMFWA